MSLLCNAYPMSRTVCVNTGEAKISKSNLVTSFVITCSVIAFKYNDLNFMAHVDAMNPNMITIILEQLKKIKVEDVENVHVWRGSRCYDNCPSYSIIYKILKKFSKKCNIIEHENDEDIIKI